jgi:exopolysaccharide biosynthesis polyprenyl glycosylphosphotransferase
MLVWRFAARLSFRIGRKDSAQQRRVLIVGAGPVGRELQASVFQSGHLGLIIVGFLDDDLQKRTDYTDILGSTWEARRIVSELNVDDVVLALPGHAYELVSQLVADLHDLAVKVWVIPDYFHLALHKATIGEFAGIPMLDLRAPALSDYQRMVKRAFDLLVGVLALPPALILMSLIAIAIRLESRGPIFFRQERVGENGKLFKMYKFRTMVPNAEEMRSTVERLDENGKVIHKLSGDPRVTRVGRILRRTSLDELPQLFNVLKGDLSVVGPRPEIPYLVERYEPWQRERFAVPQGITGWWQVNGRSDRLMHLHTEDDLYYVQHYSLLLDVLILIKTIGVVIRGKGAY